MLFLKKVAEQRKEPIKPKFGNCLFRPGHMIIICKNQDTVNWLKAKISNIKPWENASLIAVEEKDIPRPEILVGFFPRSEQDSNEEILAFIESQNEDLIVDAWRILKRYTVKQHHVELIFTVDAVSMKSLENCKFIIDYKFGVAYIRKRNSKAEVIEDNEEKASKDKTVKSRQHFEGARDVEMSEPGPIGVDNTLKSAENNAHYTLTTSTTIVNQCSPHSKEKNNDKSTVVHSISQPDHTKKRNNNLEYRQIESHKQTLKKEADKLPANQNK